MAVGGKLTREEFEAQTPEAQRLAAWFAFQQDAFDGAGGFAAVYNAQRVSSSGARVALPDWSLSTGNYLDKHEREGMDEFRQRRAVSRYTNLVRHPLTLWLGMLLRPTVTRQKVDPRIDAFLLDCDGQKTPWDDKRAEVALRTVLLRGQPIMVSRPDDTGAQSAAENQGPPYVWTPKARDLWAWSLDESRGWNWIKLVDQVVDQRDPLSPVDTYKRCRIYTRDWWQTWQLRGDENEPRMVPLAERGGGLNGLGEVPLVLSLFDDPTGDDLFGWTPADELGQVAREDYQTISRLVEIFERATFPMLGWPVNPGDQQTIDEIATGVSAVAPLPTEGSARPGWITPDRAPADQHVEHHAHLRDDGYKALSLETVLATTAQAMSGISRQYAFQHLNAALARFAKRLALVEKRVLRLVLRYYNETDEQARKIVDAMKIEPPDDFDIRDEAAELERYRVALEMPIDSVCRAYCLRGVRAIVAPKMDAKDLKASDDEIKAQQEDESNGEPTDEERAAAEEAARKQAQLDELIAAKAGPQPPAPAPEG